MPKMANPLELARNLWFARTLKIALGASLPAYFIFLFLNRELAFLRIVEIPLMFASVLVLISMTERVERRLDGDASVSIETYASQAEFYRELRNRVDRASGHVYTSYLRRYEPALLGDAAKSYFAECKAWAQRSDAHIFRRVITRSSIEHDRKWIEEQRNFEGETRKRGRHYTVRILPWDLHDADAISVAIIDSEYIFVAFSGEEDKLTGFSLRSPRLAQDYFLPYYERIWTASTALAQWESADTSRSELEPLKAKEEDAAGGPTAD
ncbi:hypothetical protein AB0C07_09375 [Actinoplanes missouriensis]|uniref:hypothetical protein n=1 Tax=Actinoplanes missouriensis TaxID=1866 RepID=UPI0033D97590